MRTNNIVSVRASLYDHALPVHNPNMVTVWIRAKVNIRKLIVVSAGTPSRNHSGTDASANDGNSPRPRRMVEMLYEKLNASPRAQSPVIMINPEGLIFRPPILGSSPPCSSAIYHYSGVLGDNKRSEEGQAIVRIVPTSDFSSREILVPKKAFTKEDTEATSCPFGFALGINPGCGSIVYNQYRPQAPFRLISIRRLITRTTSIALSR